MAVARLLELGKDEIGCVSTGNVGTAVASLAAKAGVTAYVFYPRTWSAARRAPAGRWAPPSASSTATTTKPTAPAASWPWPAASSSPTSPCGRSTPRARRRSPTRSSSSSTGWRRTTSSSRRPAARSPRASTRAWTSWRWSAWRRRRAPRSTSPRPRGAARSRPRSSTARVEIEPQTPQTAAHSIAIGAPGDGALVVDAVMSRGGSAAAVERHRDLRGDRPARRHRGDPHRAGRRHDDRLARRKLANEGKLGPDDTVVAIVSGNGYKTLDEHPDKPWAGRRRLRRRAR